MTIIKEPGKFEGEPTYVPYLWDVILNGDGESIDGDDQILYTIVGIDPDDVEAFPELTDVDCVILWESEQGFVYSREMTHKEVETFRTECESRTPETDQEVIDASRRSLIGRLMRP